MSQHPTQAFSEHTEMKRDLGLLEAVSIVISRIIGSGIFRTPAPIMALVGCTSLFGLVWVLGGIVTIFGAVIYAELAAMMPRSGGPYEYLKTAYHPFWAFLRGWAMFFVSETASIAAVALIFGEYLNALWIIVYGEPFNRVILYSVAMATIWGLTWVNLYGVHLSGMVQNFFGFVKVAAVGSIIGVAFTSWSTGNWGNFADPLFPEAWTGSTILAVGAAMRYSFFAFSGWEGATYIAEEIKNPRRNLPLSLFIGIGGVVASALPYMMTNWFDVSNVAAPGQIPDSVKWSFYLGGIVFISAVAWTVFSSREYSPEEIAEFEADSEDVLEAIKDEFRTLVTLNLRKQWLYQTLTTSAFVYYSPSDKDSYTRLVVSYALSDEVTLTGGANLFTADDPRTQFGMNDDNDNVYARIRYGF